MDNKITKILVVDDEEDIREFLSYNLNKEGFNVKVASNGVEAIKISKKQVPDLILLDVMMPEMDGIETCEQLRNIELLKHTVIAFLTARAEDYSQIAGFNAGGDDYISKPVRPKVLVSRIKALLKRRLKDDSEFSNDNKIFTVGNIEINWEKFIVKYKGNELNIPKKEFYLLSLLLSKPSKVFTREEIYAHVWGGEVFVGDRTIDVYIRKLRERFGDASIKTIKGIGYKYEGQPE